MPLFSYAMRQLALGNSTRGAGVGTSTAIDAGTGVDHVVVIALSDSTNGASALASATAHASVADDIGHRIHLQTSKLTLLYHNFSKLQC